MLQTAFRPSYMNRASVFEWHKRFKEVRESVRDDKRQDNTPVHNSILVTDYLTKMGIKTVTHPSYSPHLAICDFWLFPKLRRFRYETTEEMKEAMTNVIDLVKQDDFQRASQKLVER